MNNAKWEKVQQEVDKYNSEMVEKLLGMKPFKDDMEEVITFLSDPQTIARAKEWRKKNRSEVEALFVHIGTQSASFTVLIDDECQEWETVFGDYGYPDFPKSRMNGTTLLGPYCEIDSSNKGYNELIRKEIYNRLDKSIYELKYSDVLGRFTICFIKQEVEKKEW